METTRTRRGRAHEILRRATSAAHHALDHHPALQRLMASDLTRARYADSLAIMYRPHVTLEGQVHEASHHAQSGLVLRARAGLLAADLLQLHRPICPVTPVLPDPSQTRAAWWGRVYVLEGSRQGSALIATRIRASLGDDIPLGFFSAANPQEEHMAMLALRERELESDDDMETAIASARAAFAAYRSGLERPSPGAGG